MLTTLLLLACSAEVEVVNEESHEAHDAHDKSAKKADAHGHDEEAEHAGMKTDATIKDGWAHYGDAFTKDASVPCKTVTADPDASVDQVVRVEGQIQNVCQKAGCWMVVADDDGKYLRITMKDHAFGVPTDTKTGPETRVDVEGKLIKKELDAKTLAHLKSEAKGTDEELEEQFAPKYEIVAHAVAVKGS